ncbi:MAG: UvrD-helicase domain-containing protein [Chloroflexi bacterium]|nr:UvrD-helicase domain-containing protein [Chloroflexota bacterium]
MTQVAPADQAARVRIRTDLKSTLFVQAGAGTGKTRELIERIVRLVSSGTARLRSIAAITFTESAAAELRDRIRIRIEQAEQDPDALTEEERGRCRSALAELDGAAIETLHGFAQRILTEHPLEAGLPPLIEVQDEISASIAFEEHWAAFVDRLLNDGDLEDVLLRSFTIGLKVEDLCTVARKLHQNWDRLQDDPSEQPPLIAIDTSDLARELEAIARLRDTCTAPDDKMVGHLEGVEVAARRLAAAKSELEQLRVLLETDRIKYRFGQKANWQEVSVDEVRDRLKEAHDLRGDLLAQAGASVIPPLLSAIQRFVLDYAAERRTQGRLEFHDLLILARNLLRDDATVREAVRKQFSHLLIDEFQDTDPLQIEIAVLLASSGPAEGVRWQDAHVDEGRLFFVGDPKQSIYRFRRADIDLYQATQEHFSSGVVQLQQNYRSVGPVIDWLNEMFAHLMGAEPVPGQAAHVALEASRGRQDKGPAIRLFGRASIDKETVADIRSLEAQDIVRTVLATKSERWQILDQADDAIRDAKYADIAILIPTRTVLPRIEEALEEARIPYRVESQSLVYDTQEVRDLLSVLRAIDDPTDEVALIAALRAPAFACGDDDLLRFRKERGRWDYRARPPASLPEDDPVVEAMRALHDLHRRRWWEPINAIVEAVIRERRLFELAFAHRRPRERWQRLRLVLDQSRAFAEAGGRTLRQFIDWAERQAEEGTRIVETAVPEPDDDAVRIMTVHAAKGLEFPIVLLAGLNIESGSQRRSEPVLWHEDGRMEIAIGTRYFQTPGYDERFQDEDRMDEFEKIRVLYVAATRARDHLIVSLYHKAKSETLASRLFQLSEPLTDLWHAPAPVALPQEAHAPMEFDDSAGAYAAWLNEREQRIESLRRVPTRSATEIVKRTAGDEDDPNVQKDPPVEEVPPWRRGRAGTALGRAVHAVLQSIDMETRANLESAAKAQADAEGIAGRWQEIARMVEAALDSASLREAISGGRYWRELFVSAPIGNVSIEGFIDLLYETNDGLVVVDYKTDRAPGEQELEAALERYTPQGATYALAVEEALGRTVAKCVFVFVEPRRSRERHIEDLKGAMADVRAQLALTATGGAPPSLGEGQLSPPSVSPE